MLVKPQISGVVNTPAGFISLTTGGEIELPADVAKALIAAGSVVEVKRPQPRASVPKGMETKAK